jgi:murein DD-endopeptidase MepM/ murein hydrolase activator NlpD
MKLILVNQRYGHSRTIVIKGWLKGLLSLCLLGAPVALGYMGYHLALANTTHPIVSEKTAEGWEQHLDDQAQALAELKQNAEQQVEALTLRLGTLQARLLRLDALGVRLIEVAELDPSEFNFNQQTPGVGGLLLDDSSQMEPPDFIRAITRLEQEIESRGNQLEAVAGVINGQQAEQEASIAGRPVNSGWLSSGFGRRTDPFTGRLAWHNGIDFAGTAGDDIVSVGTGVVKFSGIRAGYGLLVEVDHGNGYLTRYAHAQQLLVEPGEIVNQGQAIALIGSTGRSTGPHVHFEVFKNGRVVDPASYIRRTHR